MCVELPFSFLNSFSDYPEPLFLTWFSDLNLCLLRLSLTSDLPSHGLFIVHYICSGYDMSPNRPCFYSLWKLLPLVSTIPFWYPSSSLPDYFLPVSLISSFYFDYFLTIGFSLVFPSWPSVPTYFPGATSLSHESKYHVDTDEPKLQSPALSICPGQLTQYLQPF